MKTTQEILDEIDRRIGNRQPQVNPFDGIDLLALKLWIGTETVSPMSKALRELDAEIEALEKRAQEFQRAHA